MPPAAVFPQKASRDLTLLQKMGMQAGKGLPGILRVGRWPWGLPRLLGCLRLGPWTLAFVLTAQNDEKEKLRIEKDPGGQRPGLEPSGAHLLAHPQPRMSLHAPRQAPSSSLELTCSSWPVHLERGHSRNPAGTGHPVRL